jgi:hypothetical protein
MIYRLLKRGELPGFKIGVKAGQKVHQLPE